MNWTDRASVRASTVIAICFAFGVGFFTGRLTDRAGCERQEPAGNSPSSRLFSQETMSDKREDAEQDTARNIVLPHVVFTGLDLRDALRSVTAMSADYDPNGKGVHICLGLSGANGLSTNTISYTGTNVTVEAVVQAIAKMVQADYETRPSLLLSGRFSGEVQ